MHEDQESDVRELDAQKKHLSIEGIFDYKVCFALHCHFITEHSFSMYDVLNCG